MATGTPVSLEAFLSRDDIDERRLELIDGEVREKMAPTWGHGRIALTIGSVLDEFGYASVEPRAIIPEAGNRDEQSLIPDVAFYREEPPADDDWMRRPPNIAVEVRSPGQSRVELRAKVDIYRQFGVQSVWLVDPELGEVEVYEGSSRRILGGGDMIETAIVPGLSLAVATLFEPKP